MTKILAKEKGENFKDIDALSLNTYRLGHTGSGTSSKYYHIATFTLNGRYRNITEKWDCIGRNQRPFQVYFRFESFGAGGYDGIYKTFEVSSTSGNKHVFVITMDYSLRQVKIYYKRPYTDWNQSVLKITSAYNNGSIDIERHNTDVGAIQPDGADETIVITTG